MASRRTSPGGVSGVARKTLTSAGDVMGPASSTDEAIVRWDGTTGTAIQNSGVTIDDTNNATFPLTTELRFRTATQRAYSNSAGQLTIEALVKLILGIGGAGGNTEFGDGTNATNIVPTSGNTLSVGTTGSPITDVRATGTIYAQPGDATSTWARCGGTLSTNATAVGNVGTGEDDLMTYSVPANTLATNLDHLIVRGGGTCAANANNKTIKVKFGATTLVSSGVLALNGADWRFYGEIIRTSATTQKGCFALATSSALLVSTVDYTTPGETLSGAVTVKATGEATSNNDIVQEYMIVQWFGA